jgi:hypothetical protein
MQYFGRAEASCAGTPVERMEQMLRVLIAGVLGGIAMFVWTSIAHVATPLGRIGFSQITNEAPVLAAMQSAMADKPGLYFFPWVDPADPNMEKNYQEKMRANPSGLILYRPPSANEGMTPVQLAEEFSKELVQTLIAAFLLSLTTLGAYIARVGFVALIGVSAGIATNVSYFIWFGFPWDYTAAYASIEIIGGLVAGLVIAAIVRGRTAA